MAKTDFQYTLLNTDILNANFINWLKECMYAFANESENFNL